MLPPSLQHIVKPQDRMLCEIQRRQPGLQRGHRVTISGSGNVNTSQGTTEKGSNLTSRVGQNTKGDYTRTTQTQSLGGQTISDRKVRFSHDPVDLQSTQRDLGIQHQTPRGGSFFSQGGSRGRRSSGGGGRRKSAGGINPFPRLSNMIGRVVDSKWAKPITVPFNWLSSRI